MLAGNRKLGHPRFSDAEMLLHNIHLFQQHSRIRQQFFPFPGKDYTLFGPDKNSHSHFFFQVMDRCAEAWLGYKEFFCRFCDISTFGRHFYVGQLLQCHRCTPFALFYVSFCLSQLSGFLRCLMTV